MKKIDVTLALTEMLLGTASANPELHREFIAAKAPDAQTEEEEVAALGVDAVVEKGMTVFARTEDGTPHLWDYQIKGFFKDACAMLARVPKTKSGAIKAYKKVIDGTIFVTPRCIPLMLAEGASIGNCQRSLRVNTPQGPRVTLANSETVPVGTCLAFTIVLLDPGHEPLVREWLDYGALRGLGQWRNSGCGRFTWQ